ncbi:uncharacterized protein LOC135930799 [Gordionus sp. m RMFG-2023]|uniref:uncharacterized protein LOC135930799 n=1 Tax=Gordionus sp. m RMFG-2023 TaxID=3053472 RepID=UPI0031FD3B8A
MALDFSENIKKEVYQKLISLKLDIATRYDRSILGINIQFINNGKIKLRTLCMKVIKERHTSEYLKKIILDVLKEYEIKIEQIYTITTDNAANMIKLIKLLILHDEEDDDLNDYLINDDLNNNDIDNDDLNNNDIIHDENKEPFNIKNINCIKCQIHINSEQLTMGDFYAAWIKCLMQTSKVYTPFARLLVSTMKAREINFKNENIEILNTMPTCSYSKDNLDDDFEDLLKSHESLNKNNSQGIENYNKCIEIEYIIRSFDNIERLEKDTNLLNYWENVKNSMPELYKLAITVLAVPATQVSVERAFSSLKFILSAQRTKLNPEILENILVIRSNSLFKPK